MYAAQINEHRVKKILYATHILMITEAFDGMKPASFAILLPFYVPFILEVGIRSLCDGVKSAW